MNTWACHWCIRGIYLLQTWVTSLSHTEGSIVHLTWPYWTSRVKWLLCHAVSP